MLIMSAGCGKKRTRATSVPNAPRAQQPLASVPLGYTEQGIASWYGVPYHGRPAADGEIYDMETLVAAHRTLPFNTWLKVTNVGNGKSVNVRIIDRGPFVPGRVLDLSKAAARQIDLIGPGTGLVRMQVISAPAGNPSTDRYAVQIGAFSSRENADRVRAEYAQKFGAAEVLLKAGPTPLWRVVVGRESSLASAQQLAETLRLTTHAVFVVRLDPETPADKSDSPVAQGTAPAPAPTQP